MAEPDYGDEAQQNAAAMGIQLGPQHFDSVRSDINAIPSPDSGLSVLGALKSTATSILNLMEAGHGDRPVTTKDALSIVGPESVAGRFYPVGSLGVFGSNFAGKEDSALLAKLNAGLDEVHKTIDANPNMTDSEANKLMQQRAGFSKDYNGNWNFEIDDSKAELKPITGHSAEYSKIPEAERFDFHHRLDEGSVKLPEVLDHPDLFEAFPYLKDVKIKPVDGQYYTGFYDHSSKTIGLDFNQSSDELMGTVLHEVQHAVNAHEVDNGLKKSMGESAEPKYIKDSLDKVYDIYSRAASKGLLSDEERTAVNNVLKRLTDTHKAYEVNPGEVEARNTTFRRGMSEEQRKTYSPSSTEDTDRQFQIDMQDYRALHDKARAQGVFK